MPIDKVPAVATSPWPRGTGAGLARTVSPATLPAPSQRPDGPSPAPSPWQDAEGVAQAVLHGVSANGTPVALPGSVRGAEGLARGDVLMVQVQATTPRLELGLFEVIARPAHARPAMGALPASLPVPAADPLPAAMQPDQLVLRQLSWRLPEPAALATQWRLLVLSSIAPALARAAQADRHRMTIGESHAPEPARLTSPREQGQPFLPTPDRWLYPAYAWGGLHAALRVQEPEPDPPPPRRRQARSLALRLEIDVPGIGAIAVLIQLLDDGVQLLLFVPEGRALARMQETLPVLASALALGGVRLVRSRVVPGLPPAPRPPMLPGDKATVPAAAWLSPPLFRAAAEIVVALSSTLVPPGSVAHET